MIDKLGNRTKTETEALEEDTIMEEEEMVPEEVTINTSQQP